MKKSEMTFYRDYYFKNGKTIIVPYEGTNDIDFCSELKVTEIRVSLNDGSQNVVIHITGSKPFELPRELLAGDILSHLVKHGLSVANVREYNVTLSEILFDTEKSAKRIYVHNRVGFHRLGKQLLYFAENVCSDKIDSQYTGSLSLGHKGSFESWIEGVRPLVRKFPATMIAMAMGASAPVVYLLKKVSIIDETPLYSIIGRSSVGKTTMLMLSASVWGKPSLDGVISPLTGTEAGFYAALADKYGFPHYVDETSTSSKINFSNLIYEVTNGREGNKCLSDGSLRPPREWLGSVTFTGEKSLLSQTNKNSGVYARVAEFDIQWFYGDGVAEAIKAHVSKNYGTAYHTYIDTLKLYTKKSLVALFNKCHDELLCKTPICSSIAKRLLKKYALLLVSVDIMTEAWNLEFDRDMVIDLLSKAFYQCLPETEAIDAFYENFLLYLSSNTEFFPQYKRNEMFSGSKLGVRDTFKNRRCVWITANTFEELLNKNGLGCSEGILHEMKDKGMLAYFSDRFRRDRNIGGLDLSCYCVYLDAKFWLKKDKQKDSNN